MTSECRNCPIRRDVFRELWENLIVNCENVMTEILLLHCRFSSWALRVSCTSEFGCFIQQSRIGTRTQMEVSQALRFGKVWPYRVLLKNKKDFLAYKIADVVSHKSGWWVLINILILLGHFSSATWTLNNATPMHLTN